MFKKKELVPVSYDGFRRTIREDLRKYKGPALIVIQDDDSLIVYYFGDANFPQAGA